MNLPNSHVLGHLPLVVCGASFSFVVFPKKEKREKIKKELRTFVEHVG